MLHIVVFSEEAFFLNPHVNTLRKKLAEATLTLRSRQYVSQKYFSIGYILIYNLGQAYAG